MSTTARKQTAATLAQMKLIHALKRVLNYDTNPDKWHVVLYDRFKVISSKELNVEQAGKLIDEMMAVAIEGGVWEKKEDKRQRFNKLAARPGMASPEQLRKIEATWQEVSRVPEGTERVTALRNFINRVAKVSDLRFLDADGVGKVLIALKAMQAKKTGAKRKVAKKTV